MTETASRFRPEPFDDRCRRERAEQPPGEMPRPEETLAIVVGAMPKAEWSDRPLAARLARLVREWQAATLADDEAPLAPLVVSDLWFVNDPDLRAQPSIAIGAPDRNAATAWQATRLPRAFAVDGTCAIHFDPEFLDGGVCLWGEGPAGMDLAFESFVSRHLDRYLREMHLAVR